MTGGLIQLSAKGTEANMLFGNPSTKCFLTTVRRKTNYATEFIPCSFSGRTTFGNSCKVKISKEYGDIANKMFLKIKLPEVPYTTEAAWIDEIGHFLLETIEIRINGITIDTHTGLWLSIYNNLVLDSDQDAGYNEMIGNTEDLKGTSTSMITGTGSIPSKTIYVPLQFWFNQEKHSGLPVVTLYESDIEIIVKFREIDELLKGDPVTNGLVLEDVKLYVEYVYLERNLRKCFLDLTHDYLITQLQIHEESLLKRNSKVEVMFNHPVGEIISIIQDTSYFSKTDIDKTRSKVSDENGENPLNQFHMQINGVERFRKDDGAIFNLVLPYYYHSNVPKKGINVYPFSTTPEELHPTGTLNFGKVDDIVLTYDLNTTAATKDNLLTIFAVNYNVLRIQNRVAGLVFYT